MPPWTFDMKFPFGTQFTFGSLTFAVRENEDLKMLPPRPALKHPTPAPSSTSGSTCSGSDPFAGLLCASKPLRYVSVINDNHLVSLMNFNAAKVN
jgi:hypothetical protein